MLLNRLFCPALLGRPISEHEVHLFSLAGEFGIWKLVIPWSQL